MRYSKGIMWLDDCRIPIDIKKETPTGDMYYLINNKKYPNQETSSSKIMGSKTKRVDLTFTEGRFTPNLLCMDDVLNDGTITKATAAGKKGKSGFVNGYESGDYDIPYGDKGSNSRYYDLDKWFNKMIDRL